VSSRRRGKPEGRIATARDSHNHSGRAGRGRPDTGTRLLAAFALTGSFMVVEVIGGVVSGSLALLADAGHMLTDAASLALAWLAFRVAGRPAGRRHTYGFLRAEVLAAFVNGLALLAITAWVAWEAASRLLSPVEVRGGVLLGVAVAGLAVNLAAFAVLHGGERGNLNLRGALLHVLGDLLGSAAAITAGLVVLATGWRPIDPLLSLVVAALILRSAWHLLRTSAHILLEGSPAEAGVEEIARAVRQEVDQAEDVHHVHVWSLAPGHPIITMHVDAAPEADLEEVQRRIDTLLRERFASHHNTIQVETAGCDHRVCSWPPPGGGRSP
jgi:cobalt-zinc-cadmium efflux system protein